MKFAFIFPSLQSFKLKLTVALLIRLIINFYVNKSSSFLKILFGIKKWKINAFFSFFKDLKIKLSKKIICSTRQIWKILKFISRNLAKFWNYFFLSKLKAFMACCKNFFNSSYSQNIKNEIMFSRVRKQQAKKIRKQKNKENKITKSKM